MLSRLMAEKPRKKLGRQSAKVEMLPPPTGGWNARDPLSAMKPEDAIVLDNIIPGDGAVRMRRGYSEWATGLSGTYVETLMEYSPPTGSPTLFAATPTTIYDVTASGAAVSSVAAMSNGRWQHVNMATTGGNFLCCVNGQNNYRTYDGSSWTDQGAALTGVTSSTLIHITSHKSRLWFTQANTLDLWYLATQAITGAATKFPVGPLCRLGGHILTTATWTKDGGDGMDDLFVIITNNGEVIVYNGTDPSDADAWSLVGVFRVAEPIGRRCMIKVGADLGIITSRGVALLSQIIGTNRSGQGKVAVSNKISGAYQSSYAAAGTSFGWQVVEYPRENLIIVNVPIAERVTQYQYVLNVETGSWCRFRGLNAGCWSLLGDDLFFGGNDGIVYKYGPDYVDNGDQIPWYIQSAYTTLKSPQTKRFCMARPLILGPSGYTPAVDLKTDYDTSVSSLPATVAASSGTPWGSPWGSPWGYASTPQGRWQAVEGWGQAASIAMSGALSQEFVYNSCDLMWEPGTFL